jgi:hypothetical protein
MGFVILFIIESHLTYVNEFKNKDCFHCYFGLSFFHHHFPGVASASASVDSTISAYTLTYLAHPSIASMASSSVTSSKKMCLHQCRRCGILCECDRRACLRPFFPLFVHNCQQSSTMTNSTRG